MPFNSLFGYSIWRQELVAHTENEKKNLKKDNISFHDYIIKILNERRTALWLLLSLFAHFSLSKVNTEP